MPFTLRRRQFPVRLAFAMTINKAQGQTLKMVGIFLPKPVFTHGQLYVAMSRIRCPTAGYRWVEGCS
jgi:ATP-dependent DNA helicase PIF1